MKQIIELKFVKKILFWNKMNLITGGSFSIAHYKKENGEKKNESNKRTTKG